MLFDRDNSKPGRLRSTAVTCVGALGVIAAVACDQAPTSPIPKDISPVFVGPRASVAPGQIAVYKDRAAWEAAVSAAGGSATLYNFTGLTLGRIASRSVDYGPFRIAVDRLSATSGNNPGIDSLAPASCSVPPADATCNRFIFNMADPTSTLDMPKIDSLVMPQPVLAWGAFFAQTGTTGGGSTTSIGATSISFGSLTFNLPDSLATNGNGFLGFILGTPVNTIVFTFVKSGTLQNDLIEVYKPAFSNAPAGPDPGQMISDLRSYVANAGLTRPIVMKIDGSLGKASAALTAGQTSVACGHLQDVIDYVNKQSTRKVPASVSTEITTRTIAIGTEIGC